MSIETGVFDGPGLPLLLELEWAGFDLAVRDGELWVNPVGQLTAKQRAGIRLYRDDLLTLVRCCDDGVQERMVTARQLMKAALKGTLPAFVFRPGTPWDKGACFSCGVPLDRDRYGRCWRCSLAWQMAMPITFRQSDSLRAELPGHQAERIG